MNQILDTASSEQYQSSGHLERPRRPFRIEGVILILSKKDQSGTDGEDSSVEGKKHHYGMVTGDGSDSRSRVTTWYTILDRDSWYKLRISHTMRETRQEERKKGEESKDMEKAKMKVGQKLMNSGIETESIGPEGGMNEERFVKERNGGNEMNRREFEGMNVPGFYTILSPPQPTRSTLQPTRSPPQPSSVSTSSLGSSVKYVEEDENEFPSSASFFEERENPIGKEEQLQFQQQEEGWEKKLGREQEIKRREVEKGRIRAFLQGVMTKGEINERFQLDDSLLPGQRMRRNLMKGGTSLNHGHQEENRMKKVEEDLREGVREDGREEEDSSFKPSFLYRMKESMLLNPWLRFGIRMNQFRRVKKNQGREDEKNQERMVEMKRGENLQGLNVMKMNEEEKKKDGRMKYNVNENGKREELEGKVKRRRGRMHERKEDENMYPKQEKEVEEGSSQLVRRGNRMQEKKKPGHHFHREGRRNGHQVKRTSSSFHSDKRREEQMKEMSLDEGEEIQEEKEKMFNHEMTDEIEGREEGWSLLLTGSGNNQEPLSNIMRNEEREWERVIGNERERKQVEGRKKKVDSITTSILSPSSSPHSSSSILSSSSPFNKNNDSIPRDNSHTHTLAHLERKSDFFPTSSYSFNGQVMNGHDQEINHPNDGTIDDCFDPHTGMETDEKEDDKERKENGKEQDENGKKSGEKDERRISSLLQALQPEPISPDIRNNEQKYESEIQV